MPFWPNYSFCVWTQVKYSPPGKPFLPLPMSSYPSRVPPWAPSQLLQGPPAIYPCTPP